jgi:hypothetical protein
MTEFPIDRNGPNTKEVISNMKHLSIAVLLLSLPTQAREFTNTQGRKVEAEFAGFNGASVNLRLASGKITSLPISKLGPTDHEYLKSHPARFLPPIKIDPKSACNACDQNADGIYIGLDGKKIFDHPVKNEASTPFQGPATIVELGGIHNAFFDHRGKVLLSTKALGPWRLAGRWDDDLLQCWNNTERAHGFLNHDGTIAIPFQFTLTTPLRNGVAWVTLTPLEEVKAQRPTLWKLINKKGVALAELPPGSSGEAFSSGFSRVTLREGAKSSILFYDTAGKPAFRDKQLPVPQTSFIDGFAIVGNGVIDTKGEWTVSPKPKHQIITEGRGIANGVVLVRDLTQEPATIHIVSVATGGIVSSFPAPHGYQLAGDGLIAVRSGVKPLLWGCLDRYGNQVVDFKFNDAPAFTQGFGRTRLPGEPNPKEVIINTNGDIIYSRPF